MSTLTLPLETSARAADPDLAVAERLIEAVTSGDLEHLGELLAPDVWFRAMLVRQVVELHDAASAALVCHGWYGTAHEVEVVAVSRYRVATRIQVSWQVRLRPEWAPDTWHLIEQIGYVRVQDGRVRRLDLLCTGFTPETELPAPAVAVRTPAALLRR